MIFLIVLFRNIFELLFLRLPTVRENSRVLRASMVGEWGSSPQCPQNKKKNMERTLKDRKYSITGLFKHIGAGNKLHVPLSCYTANSVTTECTRQNRYEGCDPMNNKFATTKKEKVGHITIIQRY